MLSLDIDWEVQGLPRDLPRGHLKKTRLVKDYLTKVRLTISNNGEDIARGVSVSPILESYVGQERPILFVREEERRIKDIRPNRTASLTFDIMPVFPGLVALAVEVKNTEGRFIKAKRESDRSYSEAPVRWWFHVVDNVAIETLSALQGLRAALDRLATRLPLPPQEK